MKLKNFVIRVLSAIVFVAVMASCILWNGISFSLLFLLILLGSLYEFYQITFNKRNHLSPYALKGSRNFVIVVSVLIFLISLLTNGVFKEVALGDSLFAKLLHNLLSRKFPFADLAVFVPPLVFVIFFHELFSKAEEPFTNIGWNIIAIFYITIPIILSLYIYFEHGRWILFAIIGLVWINDAMAYISGLLFGKKKMFTRLSPSKTIEGMIGGVVLTLLAGYLFTKLPISELKIFSPLQWVTIAFFMSVAAIFGDLVESLLKRSLQIKDTGKLLPGHGGFLDRFDAFFVAIPFAVMVIWIIQQVSYLQTLIEYLG
ncbi:MAG: CDP-archaeol synthase [Chitinophagales bacterium]|nr:phosphatidate cytidylyltransferase [Chitinophagales bacterium]MDW8272857.1 CDP-archaeol synthase [Chitinophagales bacterium]